MDVVVDASAIIAVIVNEPSKSDIIQATQGASLIAPASIHWEIANAFSAMFKRSRLSLEEAIKASGLNWCILSPGLFMQNTFTQIDSIKSDGKIIQPFANDLPLAFIDVRDTGAVAARILRDPSAHSGQVYSFTGALTTYPAFAEDFSAVLGKPITYIGVPVEKAMEAMAQRGMPEWLVEHMGTIGRIGAEGAFSKAHTQLIEGLVGRAPITTRQFVEDHKAMFN